jgi:hypothetical protein
MKKPKNEQAIKLIAEEITSLNRKEGKPVTNYSIILYEQILPVIKERARLSKDQWIFLKNQIEALGIDMEKQKEHIEISKITLLIIYINTAQ